METKETIFEEQKDEEILHGKDTLRQILGTFKILMENKNNENA